MRALAFVLENDDKNGIWDVFQNFFDIDLNEDGTFSIVKKLVNPWGLEGTDFFSGDGSVAFTKNLIENLIQPKMGQITTNLRGNIPQDLYIILQKMFAAKFDIFKDAKAAVAERAAVYRDKYTIRQIPRTQEPIIEPIYQDTMERLAASKSELINQFGMDADGANNIVTAPSVDFNVQQNLQNYLNKNPQPSEEKELEKNESRIKLLTRKLEETQQELQKVLAKNQKNDSKEESEEEESEEESEEEESEEELTKLIKELEVSIKKRHASKEKINQAKNIKQQITINGETYSLEGQAAEMAYENMLSYAESHLPYLYKEYQDMVKQYRFFEAFRSFNLGVGNIIRRIVHNTTDPIEMQFINIMEQGENISIKEYESDCEKIHQLVGFTEQVRQRYPPHYPPLLYLSVILDFIQTPKFIRASSISAVHMEAFKNMLQRGSKTFIKTTPPPKKPGSSTPPTNKKSSRTHNHRLKRGVSLNLWGNTEDPEAGSMRGKKPPPEEFGGGNTQEIAPNMKPPERPLKRPKTYPGSTPNDTSGPQKGDTKLPAGSSSGVSMVTHLKNLKLRL